MNNRQIYRRSIAPHNARVMADGGIPTDNVNAAIELLRFYEEQKDNIKHFTFPALTGIETRNSGINKFISKLYSINNPQQESLANDAVQTTSTSQPYLGGNIAPNEIACIKNPNGRSAFLTHPTISFAANEAWSVTTILNWNGHFTFSQFYLANLSGNGSYFYVKTSGGDRLQVLLNGTYQFQDNSTRKILGKNAIITFDADGLGGLKAYINGIESPVVSSGNNTSVVFAEILRSAYGKIHAHIIRSGTLTASQVLSEYNLIRNFIPEVESVVIGTQTWSTSNCEMAATPMGNVIAEMQAAGNVEKITNNTFSDATGWSVAGESTISGGVARLYSSTGALSYINWISPIKTIGKWYKLVFDIVGTSSGSWVVGNSGTEYQFSGALTGTKTIYFQAIETSLFFKRQIACDVTLDNIYCQEIGWSGSQELYDGIYAQTTGTTEQKTYAGVKAAAMWCHYNNDVALGAVYGKLYNWFAVKLLQMDIDYYNTANPTALWGWRVPTSTDFTTLSTYLGGDAVSGGKLKKEGFVYFNSPNLSADNSSGFTGLGNGYRDGLGIFSGTLSNVLYSSITEISSTQVKTLRLFESLAGVVNFETDKTRGCSIRLIKS